MGSYNNLQWDALGTVIFCITNFSTPVHTQEMAGGGIETGIPI